ncbi:hypothetical protein MPSEU_000900900 [Mayamaea pseudoterrestris]|nr:hypothetical protein MPSEU_000900900 [Mayamaea pseudoterrestris]
MKSIIAAFLMVLLVVTVDAKAPRRPTRATTSVGRSSGSAATAKRGPLSRRSREIMQEEEDNEEFLDEGLSLVADDEDEEELIMDDDDTLDYVDTKSRRRPTQPSSRTARNTVVSKRRAPKSRFVEEEEYDDYETDYRQPPSRNGPPARRVPPGKAGRRPPGAVVPYGRGPPQPAAFTRGIAALRNSLPDPEKLKAAAINSIKTAKESTSSLSSNLYRDIKGLTSSELEQVMLKSTRPDDTPVKGKHVERLVGVTYQISSRYDIYDAVLRKLWAKMAEKDWRTTLKALYILHRFSSDGAPDHAPALKARLRELRRMRDLKRKDKYFNSKQLLAGDTNAENIKFRAFLSRYAHYVIMRAQCFGGMFDEIGTLPKVDKKKPPKPITSTNLRQEHLGAAEILLKAGVACQLKDGEECENTALAVERVASDLIALTSATAVALNRALKEDDIKGADPVLLKKWCAFYKDDLLPQTRSMVKKTSPKLDAFGLFLPSRMGTTVSRDVLEKGLNLEERTAETEASLGGGESVVVDKEVDNDESDVARLVDGESMKPAALSPVEKDAAAEENAAALADEYEYDDEEYYDDEEF